MKKTVLYNDKCPICSIEIKHYEKLASDASVNIDFEGIYESGPVLKSSGLTVDEASKRLHIVGDDGSQLLGVDAFIFIWNQFERYKWLGTLASNPWIKPVANILYEKILAPFLYYKEKKRLKNIKLES